MCQTRARLPGKDATGSKTKRIKTMWFRNQTSPQLLKRQAKVVKEQCRLRLRAKFWNRKTIRTKRPLEHAWRQVNVNSWTSKASLWEAPLLKREWRIILNPASR